MTDREKQKIKWKKLPKNLHKLEKDIYLFKSRCPSLAPDMVSGRLWLESRDMDFEYVVYIFFVHVELKMPISYFTHYAEVE